MQNPWLAMLGVQAPMNEPGVPAMMQGGVPFQETPMALPARAPAAQAGLYPQDKYDQLMNRLEKRTLQGINDQRSSVEELQKYKDAILNQGANTGIDLSPLMTLADQWTGSNMARGYQAPESAGERAQKAMQLTQQIGGAQGKIADDELNLLRTQLTGELARNRADQTPKITAEQWKAGGFAARMADADAIIGSLQDVGTSRASQLQMGRFYPSELMGENEKKIDQAQRNFINAVLRRESGAAISPEEFINARKQYFPEPGDLPSHLAQKAQNRQRVIQSFSLEGGNAYQQIVGQNPIATPAAPTTGKMSFEDWKKSKGY
jgi:hypothetical protein